MSYLIPSSSAFLTQLSNRETLRYYRLKIDGTDITDKIKDFSLTGGQKAEYAQWSVILKNKDASLTAGGYANEPCTIEVKAGSSNYYTIFTGFISEKGATQIRGSQDLNQIKLTMYDRQKSRGIKRKPDAALLANFIVCNPSIASSSLLHYLGGLTGVSSFDSTLIDHTVPIVEVGSSGAWTELKKLAELYKADMYFRYDGALRFFSPFETSYVTPSSEWTFIADAGLDQESSKSLVRGKVSKSHAAIQSNRCTVEWDEYTQLATQVIYKNTENYDAATDKISLQIAAGAYWPGDGSTDYAALSFKDPDTGEAFDFATDIVTPTLGAVGSGADIEYSGGSLSIVSFNGSTSATKQQTGAAEIIIQNTGGTTAIIKKFQLRGKPYQCNAVNKVQDIDATVTAEEEYVDSTLDGRYAASVAQVQSACIRTVEHGKNTRLKLKFESDWCPLLQRGLVATFQEEGWSDITIKVLTFTHKNKGSQFYTVIEAELFGDETASRTLALEAIPRTAPQKAVAEYTAQAIAVRPTYNEQDAGYTNPDSGATNAGTTVPTTPTLAAEAIPGGIKLSVDRQQTLRYLKFYEFQVSSDSSTWYTLGMDGTDWKSGGSGGCTQWPVEELRHINIPAVQLAVSGTLTTGSDSVAVSSTEALSVGDALSGTGIPAGTTIESIDSSTAFTMTENATVSGAQTLTIGDDIGGSGDNKKYMGNTLQYRVRRVTTNAVNSSYSTVITQQAGQLGPGMFSANSILANMVQTNFLETLFANVAYQMTLGFVSADGTSTLSSPDDGDSARFLTGVEDAMKEYINGKWSTSNGIRIGGIDVDGRFRPFINCKGILNPLADDISQEFFPGGSLVDFEDGYDDQDGRAPLSAYNTTRTTAWKKFGTYSCCSGGSYASLTYEPEEFSFSENLLASAWFRRTTAGGGSTEDLLCWYSREDSFNYINVKLRYDLPTDKIQGVVEIIIDNVETDYATAWLPFPLNTDCYVALGWDSQNEDLFIFLNGSTESVHIGTISDPTPLGYQRFIGVLAYPPTYATAPGFYMDELQFTKSDKDIFDILLQYYSHDIPWNTTYSAKDVPIIPGDGGYVNLKNSPTKYYSPVSGERSIGTLHLFPESVSVNYYAFWNPGGIGGRGTFDFSSILPDGVKAVEISAVVDPVRGSTATTLFIRGSIYFQGNNTQSPNLTVGTAMKGYCIGSAPITNSYISTTMEGPVSVDADKKFYGYCNKYDRLTAIQVFVGIRGYYI